MKQVYLDTFGCQMNVADTDRMELLLFHSGYARTTDREEADLIVVNTCSIREKAEHKIYSLFGELRPLKERNPDLLFGLTGCMAQQEGERLVRRMPFIDFVMGPDNIETLPQALAEIGHRSGPLVWTGFDANKQYSIPDLGGPLPKHPGASAFVNIIKGCDKFCSFCVVPNTRGREKSREPGEILNEARQLVDRGAKEIILLGQNVNAYGKREALCPIPFHELLYRVAETPGLRRLRFTTSHPRDFTPELVRAYRDLDILMNHLHLPVQSGNDRILEAMRRGHSAEEYLDLIDSLREQVPEIALSTDIIVGFPGETDREFEDTLRLMERVRFDSGFLFQYSPRPGTPAADLPDDVPETVKKDRLQRTLAVQNRVMEEKGMAYLGREVEVLIEGRGSKREADWKGRNPAYWTVQFKAGGMELQPGDFTAVQVEAVSGHSLIGRAVAPALAS